MHLLQIVDAASSFLRTDGDKASFERIGGKMVVKLVHLGAKRSFVKYDNGTIVETIVHKVVQK